MIVDSRTGKSSSVYQFESRKLDKFYFYIREAKWVEIGVI